MMDSDIFYNKMKNEFVKDNHNQRENHNCYSEMWLEIGTWVQSSRSSVIKEWIGDNRSRDTRTQRQELNRVDVLFFNTHHDMRV